MTPWIGYARVSTEEQARSGLSIDQQVEQIEAAIRLKGGELVEVIADPGCSGKDLNRPGMLRALGLLAAGDADGLIVSKLDRLSRSVRDTCAARVGRRRRSLWALDVDMNTGTAMGQAMAHMATVFAQLERSRGAERTRDAMAQLKADGRPVGPGAVPDAVAERIRAWRAAGVTLQGCADRLNAEGVPTARGGTMWRPSSIETAARAVAPRRKPRPPRAVALPAIPRRRPARAA